METTKNLNVGNNERMISVIAGSALVLTSLRKFNLPRLATGGFLLYRGITGNCPAYRMAGKKKAEAGDVEMKLKMTVDRPLAEVYDFWRNLENLPKFMRHLESVEEHEDGTSSWVAKMPLNAGTLSWDAEIVKEKNNRVIEWQSLPGASVENHGIVLFKYIGPRETELHVTIDYQAPLGTPGKMAAQLLNPVFKLMIREDIMNFKTYLETGELPAEKEATDHESTAAAGAQETGLAS